MSEVWNKVYKSDSTFFGEEPSNFAMISFNHMKASNVKKVLELGAGNGRDTNFFASNDIEADALDYSVTAIKILGYHLLENSINRLVNLQNLLSTQEDIRIDLRIP
jgi:hypothetical protein